jgi:lysophospholipid acyltransferase (LPLAT)-like uncharacterized protein
MEDDEGQQVLTKVRHRRIKRVRRSMGRGAVKLLGGPALGLLARSWKVSVRNAEHLEAAARDNPAHVMALWHGRMLMGLPHHAHHNWHVLVSRSGDGDISNALLESFGYQVIRGSASKGGASAVRSILTALKGVGEAIILTPDGPRGPRHRVNPGVAWIAKATGYPIVPCGFVCDRAWYAKSWDRFTIPRFGARVLLTYGEPLYVPRGADEAELEAAAEEIRACILGAEQQGFDELGREPDW